MPTTEERLRISRLSLSRVFVLEILRPSSLAGNLYFHELVHHPLEHFQQGILCCYKIQQLIFKKSCIILLGHCLFLLLVWEPTFWIFQWLFSTPFCELYCTLSKKYTAKETSEPYADSSFNPQHLTIPLLLDAKSYIYYTQISSMVELAASVKIFIIPYLNS